MTDTSSATRTILDAALEAHDAGLCVIRAQADTSKAPLGRGRSPKWEKFATGEDRPTRDDLVTWFGSGHPGMGLVCGAPSGGLEMFEFEGRAVTEGLATRFIDACVAAGLEQVVDRVFAGYFENTPSGGIHVLYRCDETGNVKLAKTEKRPKLGADGSPVCDVNGEVVMARFDLIETKGEGGFTIVAPSGGRVHKSGLSWERTRGGFDTIVTITPDERAQLHEIARTFDRSSDDDAPDPPPAKEPPARANGQRAASPSSSWMDATIADYNTRTPWATQLAGKFEHRRTVGTYDEWNYLAADGDMGATTNKLGTDRLIVFSGTAAATDGWEAYDGGPGPTPSYDKFSAHCILTTGRNDRDNRTEIARQLNDQGYGPPRHDDSWTGDLPFQHDVASKVNGNGSGPGTEDPQDPTGGLDDTFWDARPALAHIRQAAHSRIVSAEAVLHVVLARVAAITPHTTRLPATIASTCPLSYFAALVGGPSSGKSAADAVAADLTPAPEWLVDHLPLGSGEGLIDSLFEMVDDVAPNGNAIKVKRQTKHNAYVYVDEGQSLTSIGSRTGTTIMQTIRTLWTGGTAGQANASVERRRILPGGTYTYGLVAGFQPALAAGLLDDAAGGTPQRFGWADADDITLAPPAPPWPGRLPWEPPVKMNYGGDLELAAGIVDQVVADRYAVVTKNVDVLPLDAHANLYRLKVAGLLAVLDGRRDVTLDDWELAGLIRGRSNSVRARVIAAVAFDAAQNEEATRRRLAGRQIHVADAIQTRRTVDGAKKIADKVIVEPGCARAALRRDLRRWRDVFDDALDHAKAEGWVVERTEPGQGTDKRTLHPGGSPR